jgi:hypothetical protein
LGKLKTCTPVYQNNQENPMMKLLPASALIAIFAASPAFAKMNCDAEFRAHMTKMSPYLPTPDRADTCRGCNLAVALGKSVDAYKACKAGDEFSPHGVWDQVIADMAANSKE